MLKLLKEEHKEEVSEISNHYIIKVRQLLQVETIILVCNGIFKVSSSRCDVEKKGNSITAIDTCKQMSVT